MQKIFVVTKGNQIQKAFMQNDAAMEFIGNEILEEVEARRDSNNFFYHYVVKPIQNAFENKDFKKMNEIWEKFWDEEKDMWFVITIVDLV